MSLVSKQFSLLNNSFHLAAENFVIVFYDFQSLHFAGLSATHRYSLNGEGQAEKPQSRKARCILGRHQQQNLYNLPFFGLLFKSKQKCVYFYWCSDVCYKVTHLVFY